jgi:hypothetical protein
MSSLVNNYRKSRIWLVILAVIFPACLLAGTKTWTGYGGDANWLNPLNWSGATIPLSTDDILLDNGDLPVSYLVKLPDVAIILRTLRIVPSAGRNIELILPATNTFTNAFSVTGPGYGIELNAGAVFRNASGLTSGESLFIADSMIIRDGARYIHQTRAAHASRIINFLSTAPGTEQGIFDFDVPRASYTISVSNRIYGSLELHSTAQGATVNYTCSGSNPLKIRGNLRIGPNVNMSIDLAGANGNIQVEGDFIQEGGTLNLSSGTGDNTVLRVKSDLYQSSLATITETSNGNPFIELNGIRSQQIALAGRIQNQVGFRLNNTAGAVLQLPLTLPFKLDLLQGAIFTTASALLLMETACSISTDSSRLTGSYVDGPLRKLGLEQYDHFLFPVGREGNLRWLELKNASGNYTVEYFHQNPGVIGLSLGAGLDHISKLEYWSVIADGNISDQAKIELSFASAQSGGVTDPDYLNVAKFQSAQWQDAGHTAATGNYIQGSILSAKNDLTSQHYTLASTLDLENPLPLTTLHLEVSDIEEQPVFTWMVETDEVPDHFELYEEKNGQIIRVAEIKACPQQKTYRWTGLSRLSAGNHYFRLIMVNVKGVSFKGEIVQYKTSSDHQVVSLVLSAIPGDPVQLMIRHPDTKKWSYEILNIRGQRVGGGIINLDEERQVVSIGSGRLANGIYVIRVMDASGKKYAFQFVAN